MDFSGTAHDHCAARISQMSYLQIKRFVDEQIKVLNTPLVLDEEIRRLILQNGVAGSQAQSVLFKCNLLIKRHNRKKFNKQVVHQIVQQVAKAEHENLMLVNKALAKISRILQPVMTDQFASSGRLEDRLRLLNNLADILPEGRYLFAIHGDNEGADTAALEAKGATPQDENTLVRDDAELMQSAEDIETRRQCVDAVRQEMDRQVGTCEDQRARLRGCYDDLRARLALLNEELVYKMEKLAYLRQLNLKMRFLAARRDGIAAGACDSEVEEDGEDDGASKAENEGASGAEDGEDMLQGPSTTAGGLRAQMGRFSLLVEKLQYALQPE